MRESLDDDVMSLETSDWLTETLEAHQFMYLIAVCCTHTTSLCNIVEKSEQSAKISERELWSFTSPVQPLKGSLRCCVNLSKESYSA